VREFPAKSQDWKDCLGTGTGREAGADYGAHSESLVKMGVSPLKNPYQQDGFQAAAGRGWSSVT